MWANAPRLTLGQLTARFRYMQQFRGMAVTASKRPKNVGDLKRRRPAVASGRSAQMTGHGLGPLLGRKVSVQQGMTVSELAVGLKAMPAALLGPLSRLLEGPLTAQTEVPLDVAEMLVVEAGGTAEVLLGHVHDLVARPVDHSAVRWPARPPVVTIMGHVDHGKTTLLDALRKTAVAASEAGGITQHIGAFKVRMPSNETITFLDTPGHAAFSAMRQRGAIVTDIVVLVVAAEDGVMPQTRQSIEFARAANVPIVVAINKCDKPGIDLKRVKQGLLQHGVELEEFGGDVQAVEISALKGINLDQLEQAILMQAELKDLRGERTGAVEGYVIEAHHAKGQGPVATVLVRRGTLKPGSCMVAGSSWGKVRTLRDSDDKIVKAALPSDAVQVSGWNICPGVGELVLQASSEQHAREVVTYRMGRDEMREAGVMLENQVGESIKSPAAPSRKAATKGRNNFRAVRRELADEEIRKYDEAQLDTVPTVRLLLKSDVAGSEEAILQQLDNLPQGNARVVVIHSDIGDIVDSDIELAKAAKASILCFNIKSNRMVDEADRAGVPVWSFRIIYELLKKVEDEMLALLPKQTEDVPIGKAKILQLFHLTGSRKAVVAGCQVTSGTLRRNALYRVLRKKQVVFEGEISALKRMKDDVEMVTDGMDCGVSFSTKIVSFEPGDQVMCFERRTVVPKLV